MGESDTFDLIVTIGFWIVQSVQTIIAFYILYKAYKEITDYYIDLLKLGFGISYFLQDIFGITQTLVYLMIKPKEHVIAYVIIDYISSIFILISCIIPIMYWVIMIYYIRKLKLIGNNISYQQIKKEVNSFEIKVIVVIATYFVILIGIMIWVGIIQGIYSGITRVDDSLVYSNSSSICKTQEILDFVLSVIWYLSLILLLFLNVIVYFKLTKLMNKTLFVYYQENKQSLKILMISNFIYYILQIFIQSILYFSMLLYNTYLDFLNLSALSFFLLVILYLCIFIKYISYGIFGILNAKTINFKLYVATIMYGLRIQSKFEGTSLFVARSGKWTNDEDESENSSDYLNLRMTLGSDQ